ncbi:SMC5-SMC6 complex localization factor protein 2 [Stigmatopora argus]
MTITKHYFRLGMKMGAEIKRDSRVLKILEHCSPSIKETPTKPFQTPNLIGLPGRRLPLSSPEMLQMLHQLPRHQEQCPPFLRMPLCSSAHHRQSLSPNSSTCSLSQNVGEESKSVVVSDSRQRLPQSAKKYLTPSPNEKSIPAVCFRYPQKRHRECEDGIIKSHCLKSLPSPSKMVDEPCMQSPPILSEVTVKQCSLAVKQLKIFSYDGKIAYLGDVSNTIPEERNGKEQTKTDQIKDIIVPQQPRQKSSKLSIKKPRSQSLSHHLPTQQKKPRHRRRMTDIPRDSNQLFASPPFKCDDGNPQCKNSGNFSTKSENGASPVGDLISSEHRHISAPYVSLARLKIDDIEACKPFRDESKKNISGKPSTDSCDKDLNLRLGVSFQSDSSHASKSSDEDQLLSLEEFMNPVSKAPVKSEKSGGFSSIAINAPTISGRLSYENSLDKILDEIGAKKKSKECEAQLRTSCDETMSVVSERHEEEISISDTEKEPEFLQCHSLPLLHQLPSSLKQTSSPESQHQEQCPPFLRMPLCSSAHRRQSLSPNSSTCSPSQNVGEESKSVVVSDSRQRLSQSAKKCSTPSPNEKSIPAVCLRYPEKRHRECEDGAVKRHCLKMVDEPCMQSPPILSEVTVKQCSLAVKQLRINSYDGKIAYLGDVFNTIPEERNGKEQTKTDQIKDIIVPQQPRQNSSKLSIKTRKLRSESVSHHLPTQQKKPHHRRRTTEIPKDSNQLFASPPFKYNDGNPQCKNSGNFSTKSENGASPVEDLISSEHRHKSLPYVSLAKLKIDDIEACEPFRDEPKNNISGKPSTDERQKYKVNRSPVVQIDTCDEDLDLSLGISFQSDSSLASKSSDEDQLLSLEEIMNPVSKAPSHASKSSNEDQLLSLEEIMNLVSEKSGGFSSVAINAPTISGRLSYKNSLDQMLDEIGAQKKSKECEAQLRTSCDEVMSGVSEHHEEEISEKQAEFLQRHSLDSSMIEEVPPGATVFHLDKLGQIFSQDSLQLRRCSIKAQNKVQKIILGSSPTLFKLHLNAGLFQQAFGYHSPCPSQVSQFLFKMMSVHSERILSEKILQVLCDTAKSAAYNIAKTESEAFAVWVPSLADLTLVLMNMGASFVTLFPFENPHPAFTEGDVLENEDVQSQRLSANEEREIFPEHNCSNILKYLSYCLSLRPSAYGDDELLLLLTVLARVALDANVTSLCSTKMDTLMYQIVRNVRDWDAMLPGICRALVEVTDDHHNMCYLVQLLPNSPHQFLRQHLSLSMMSKLLDGSCLYRPSGKEIKLTALRPYVRRMQPSSLRRLISNSSSESSSDDDSQVLDQQSYYLCHSLLTLTNQASNFESFPTDQKEHLLTLCSDLRTHVMPYVRNSEKSLYKIKVKDLLARIYTRWQLVLHQMQPLHSKHRDYWKPSSVGISSHRCQER